jgi:polyhydroxyalkanoate synthesis regulator phasin
MLHEACKAMNKKVFIISLFISTFSLSLLIVQPAHAQEIDHRGGDFFSGVVKHISEKFGLNKNEVQTVVNEYRSQRRTITPRPTRTGDERKARDKVRIDRLVKNGKITESQGQAMLDEVTLLRSKYKFDGSQTKEQRQTQMKAMIEESTAWANAQGVDVSYILMGASGKNDRWQGKPQRNVDTANVTPAQ